MLTFKVHLCWQDGNEEIRKFYVDRLTATNFVLLHEKLETIFPQLAFPTKFKLQWKGDYFFCLFFGLQKKIP